ncbi:MAG: proton-conducting transporter membrane subunit, partial [Anaerobacillus sp.]
AGSVIHAVHEQNIYRMGGLRKKLPKTAGLFLIGCLSISGFPLLAGFFSKDEILAATYADGRYVLFTLALLTAFLTAFYMFRLYFLVFSGQGKSSNEASESPRVMLIPMIVLGVLAVIGGYIQTNWFGTFLGDWLETTPYPIAIVHHEAPIWIPIIASVLSLAGIGLAWLMFGKRERANEDVSAGLHQLLFHKYYIDEIYQATVVKGTRVIAYFWMYFDRFMIEGGGTALTGLVKRIGKEGVKLQSGQVQTYGTVAISGLVVILLLIAVIGGYF